MSTVVRDVRARLSLLWVFVMLNMIVADIFSFMSPGALEQIMAGQAGQITITPQFLLLAAVIIEIPIAMVVLSLVLPQRAARWANITAAVVTMAYVVGGGLAAPHYYFIAGVEVLGCLVIAWTAWKWRERRETLTARAVTAD